MSEVSLRTKARALIACSASDDCRECAWYGNNDVCDNVYGKTGLIVKELLEENGVDEARTGSPKAVLRAAWQAHLIDDDEQWLAALQARNNATHAYNKEIAYTILEETRNIYLVLF